MGIIVLCLFIIGFVEQVGARRRLDSDNHFAKVTLFMPEGVSPIRKYENEIERLMFGGLRKTQWPIRALKRRVWPSEWDFIKRAVRRIAQADSVFLPFSEFSRIMLHRSSASERLKFHDGVIAERKGSIEIGELCSLESENDTYGIRFADVSEDEPDRRRICDDGFSYNQFGLLDCSKLSLRLLKSSIQGLPLEFGVVRIHSDYPDGSDTYKQMDPYGHHVGPHFDFKWAFALSWLCWLLFFFVAGIGFWNIQTAGRIASVY
jgi:hypothetical protein